MATTKIQIPQEFKELFSPHWRYFLIYGGRGSLKSHTVARRLVIVARERKVRILCTRELQKSIKDSVHKLIADIISEYGFSDFEVQKDSIRNTVTGSEFIFTGIRNNTNEIKSMEGIDFCWCEEAHALTEASIDILTPTIRKPGSQIIFTYNRLNELDPIHSKFVINKKEKTCVINVNYEVAIKYGWFPDVLQQEMELDKLENPSLYAHKWLGEPLSQTDTAIISRDAIINAMQRTIKPEGAIEIGVDVARMGGDRTVFFKRKGLRQEDKRIYSKLRTTEVCDKLEMFADFNKEVLIKVDDTGVGCITGNTSLLTPDGWRYPEHLTTGDIVYSKDESGNVTTTTVHSVSKRSTEIIEADGYKFAWAHQIPFKTRNNYEYKLGTWELATNYKQAIFDTKFNYEADEQDFIMQPQVITMPRGGDKIINPELYIDAQEFAILLGWYVSEGSLDRSSKCVTVTQKKTQHFDEIQRVMSYFGKVQVKPNGKSGGKDFKIFNQSLYKWIDEHCYNGGTGFKFKTVPRWVANNSVSVIKEFMRAFRDGDGYIHSNGRNYYVTSSVNLVDDFMELIYKTGKSGNYYKKYDKGSTFQIEGRTATRTEDNYVIFEYAKNGYGIANKQTTITTGDVYSLILNNDTRLMFTKVDGKKPFWTHNGGVTDEMMKRGYNVMPINFGAKASDPDKYTNLISEAWFYIQSHINEMQLDMDTDLIMELSSRQWKMDAKGRRAVESKDDYKKRGFRSPDIADALILCYYSGNTLDIDDIYL